MIECPHKDDCTSYPHRCNTCRHNKSKKKDYYEPDIYYRPYIPYWEWPYTWITLDNTDITTGDTSSIKLTSTTSKKRKKNYYKSR